MFLQVDSFIYIEGGMKALLLIIIGVAVLCKDENNASVYNSVVICFGMAISTSRSIYRVCLNLSDSNSSTATKQQPLTSSNNLTP